MWLTLSPQHAKLTRTIKNKHRLWKRNKLIDVTTKRSVYLFLGIKSFSFYLLKICGNGLCWTCINSDIRHLYFHSRKGKGPSVVPVTFILRASKLDCLNMVVVPNISGSTNYIWHSYGKPDIVHQRSLISNNNNLISNNNNNTTLLPMFLYELFLRTYTHISYDTLHFLILRMKKYRFAFFSLHEMNLLSIMYVWLYSFFYVTFMWDIVIDWQSLIPYALGLTCIPSRQGMARWYT